MDATKVGTAVSILSFDNNLDGPVSHPSPITDFPVIAHEPDNCQCEQENGQNPANSRNEVLPHPQLSNIVLMMEKRVMIYGFLNLWPWMTLCYSIYYWQSRVNQRSIVISNVYVAKVFLFTIAKKIFNDSEKKGQQKLLFMTERFELYYFCLHYSPKLKPGVATTTLEIKDVKDGQILAPLRNWLILI